MDNQKRYSRLAIAAFVLVLITPLLYILSLIEGGGSGNITQILFILLFFGGIHLIVVLSLIFSILALIHIKKYNLKGEIFAWIALVLSSLGFLYLLYQVISNWDSFVKVVIKHDISW